MDGKNMICILDKINIVGVQFVMNLNGSVLAHYYMEIGSISGQTPDVEYAQAGKILLGEE